VPDRLEEAQLGKDGAVRRAVGAHELPTAATVVAPRDVSEAHGAPRAALGLSVGDPVLLCERGREREGGKVPGD